MQLATVPPASTPTPPASAIPQALLADQRSRPLLLSAATRMLDSIPQQAATPSTFQQQHVSNKFQSSSISKQHSTSNSKLAQQQATSPATALSDSNCLAATALEARLRRTGFPQKRMRIEGEIRSSERSDGGVQSLRSRYSPFALPHSVDRYYPTRRARLAAGATAVAQSARVVPIAVVSVSGVAAHD